MTKYVYFEGRLPDDRVVPKQESSGLEYRKSTGKRVVLTKDELAQLVEHQCAFILKKLHLRERAATHYRWVQEPCLRASAVKLQCSGYRDLARAEATTRALESLRKDGLVRDVMLETDNDMPGPRPVRLRMTVRGAAWFKGYCDWFRETYGRDFVIEPRHDQYVDQEGYDKDESQRKHRVPALKKLDIVE